MRNKLSARLKIHCADRFRACGACGACGARRDAGTLAANFRRALQCLALLAGIGYAGAASADSIADNLTRIESETLLLKAREKQLEAQSNVLSKETELSVKQTVADVLSHTAFTGNPVIRSIEGIGRSMFATLQLHNGNLVDVQPGDTLSNGIKIISIRPNEVIAETPKKQRVRLASASTALPMPNPVPVPMTGGAMPPMLPLGVPPGGAR
jgi:type IV pilus biogenesis protein PilP